MALTPEQLQAAIQRYQGGASMTSAPAPVVAPPVQQPVIEQPAPAPVVAPPAAPPPAPVVEAPAPVAVEPPAPAAIAPTTNSRQAMAQMDQATAGQIDAGNEISAAQVQQAQDQAAVIEQQNAMEKQLQEQAQAREAERQAARDKIHSDYQELNQQASSIQEKDRRTTGQRVMGILALALGSVADGFARMGGNTNTDYSGQISSQIDAQIERDLEMQRRAIDDKRKAAASKLTELGLARQFGADEKEAEEHARIFRKEMYARELSATAARSQVPAIRANAEAAAAKLLGEAAEKKASLLTSKENAAFNAMAANARITTAEQMKPGNTPLTTLEALEKEGRLTADQAQELETVRRQIKERQNEGKETEGQAKARSLYEGSKSDADRITAALEGNKLPSGTTVRAAESSVVPDAVIPAEAQVYRSARALVNDVLRDESGASIGEKEKEELLAPLKSSDPAIVKQGYERILAKRAAMGSKSPTTRNTQRWPGAQGDAPSDTVQVEINGKVGTIPAANLEAFLKKYPEAKRR